MTIPSGIKVAGAICEIWAADVDHPKKKNPNTIVLGNIIIIPEILSLDLSASSERSVIKKPPIKNEENTCNKKYVFICFYYRFLFIIWYSHVNFSR